jgi:hypothetical protein
MTMKKILGNGFTPLPLPHPTKFSKSQKLRNSKT